jgi:hypothetical protein
MRMTSFLLRPLPLTIFDQSIELAPQCARTPALRPGFPFERHVVTGMAIHDQRARDQLPRVLTACPGRRSRRSQTTPI